MGRAVLGARIGALRRALRLAWPEAAGDDAALYERVAPRMSLRVENLARQLDGLGAALEAGQPLDGCWAGYDALSLACEPLFDECLVIRQGAAARREGLDDGICNLADHLLAEICSDADISWRRFTVLATGESYTHVSDVIRVRFPQVSLWDLPVVAHELGHHASLRLEQPTIGRFVVPFEELERTWAGRMAPALLEEYFADAFASVTLGPAYACTCLLLRFDPADAGAVGGDHPADRDRAHVILAVLGRTADELSPAEGEELRRVLAGIRATWESAPGAYPLDDGTGGDHPEQLTKLAHALYARLRDALPTAARYGEQVNLRGRALAERLLDPDYIPAPAPDDRMTLALNAGWRARLGDEPPLGRISKNLRDLLYALAARGAFV